MNTREHMQKARVRAMLKNPDFYNADERAWLERHRHLVEGGPPPAALPSKKPSRTKRKG